MFTKEEEVNGLFSKLWAGYREEASLAPVPF